MGAFSNDMRRMAKSLIKELGNACVLTKVTPGQYDPATGKTAEVRQDISTFSAQSNAFNRTWGSDGQNTNLAGFDDETVTVAWFGQVIDETWLYDGAAISEVRPVMTQDDIVIFNITAHKGP